MITVVSGLPRSGTSLMMQMLQAGGMELLTDYGRKPDSSNPMGYFEYQKVKQIEIDQSWISLAENKAVKIISPLLRFLPSGHEYSVIFMERDLNEILMSQEKMLRNFNKSFSPDAGHQLASGFKKELQLSKSYLEQNPLMRTLYLSFRHLVFEPGIYAKKTASFLDMELNMDNMIRVVQPDLYRERT